MTPNEALVLGLILGATRDGLELLGYTREVDPDTGTLRLGLGFGKRVLVTLREESREGGA